MLKKLLILLSFLNQSYSFDFTIMTAQTRRNLIEEAIINSDYDSFVNLYKNPKLSLGQDKDELREISDNVLKERIKFFNEKKFSNKDLIRLCTGTIGALAGAYFSLKNDSSYQLSGDASIKMRNQYYSLVAKTTKDSSVKEKTLKKAKKLCEEAISFFTLNNRLFLASGTLAAIGFGFYNLYQGYSQKDNSEKLKNALAIKQLLNEN